MVDFKLFVKCSLVRALKTFCQTFLGCVGSSVVLSDVDWRVCISASLLASLLSVLTSIATGLPEVEIKKENEVKKEVELNE